MHPDLPPPYTHHRLREGADACAHACAHAATLGAGALIEVRRFDAIEFALVLEPEESLASARLVLFAGLAALADTLAVRCMPDKPLLIDWPDAIRFDCALLGGVRLAWPPAADPPAWLVLGVALRAEVMAEEGFDDIDGIVGGFARHLLAALDDWSRDGPAGAIAAVQARLAAGRLDAGGDLILPDRRRSLADALAAPSWLDPATGLPLA